MSRNNFVSDILSDTGHIYKNVGCIYIYTHTHAEDYLGFHELLTLSFFFLYF